MLGLSDGPHRSVDTVWALSAALIDSPALGRVQVHEEDWDRVAVLSVPAEFVRSFD